MKKRPIGGMTMAAVCSALLTLVTVMSPTVATDWARLNENGVYIPARLDYPWPSYVVQVGLWLGIVVGVIYATSSPRLLSPFKISSGLGTRREGEVTASRIGIYLIVAAITALAFWLRAHTLDDLPLIVDEIGFAARASDMQHGQPSPIFAPGHNANPSVYSWLVALTMSALGQNAFAIRLIPLFFGTLAIPVVYLLGRVWWSRRVGLLAAAFLATYPAHVFFSRMSLYNIVDPVFAMLALAGLGGALRTGCRRKYMLAGMMAAVGQYFYHGSRLVLVLIGVYLGLSAFSYQRSSAKWFLNRLDAGPRQEMQTGVLWLVAAFVLLALVRFAPMLVAELPLEGNREVMRLPADFFPDNTLRAVLAWVGHPDVSPFWLSDAPLLLPPVMALFLIGLVISARRWRDIRYLILLLWIMLTTIFGGAIWTAAPLYVRYMTAVPAVALLVAVSYQLAVCSQKRWLRFVGTGLFLVGFLHGIAVSWWQHPVEAQARITAGHQQVDAVARQAAILPEDTSVVVVGIVLGDVERITLADYVAAYGLRRAVGLVASGEEIRAVTRFLPAPVMLIP